MKWECKKCRYSMVKEIPPKRCPYCGEVGTMNKAIGAQDILNQVEKEAK